MKSYIYVTPVEGGQTNLTHRILCQPENKLLRVFPISKLLTAFLLFEYNYRTATLTPVSKRATATVLGKYTSAIEKASKCKPDEPKGEVGYWVVYFNPHSIVGVPVGYHFDVFKGS